MSLTAVAAIHIRACERFREVPVRRRRSSRAGDPDFNLIAIGCLCGGKDSDVTGLELIGDVRGETT